jgi:hypothetical protein
MIVNKIDGQRAQEAAYFFSPWMSVEVIEDNGLYVAQLG